MNLQNYKIYITFVVLFCIANECSSNENAKRLFDDLMISYNRLRRPATSAHSTLHVKLKLRLSQIIDVHEKTQIMTTIVWLKQEWLDFKLTWDPKHYGDIKILYVPAEMIWTPDIVLYNNADSSYNITITTKATLSHDGLVKWEPPAIFKSMCMIDVEWFPFDVQKCQLQFGSWSFDETLINLQHLDPAGGVIVQPEWNAKTHKNDNVSLVIEGIDLSDYYPSVEWDILEIPARRVQKVYKTCCPRDSTFIDITYTMHLRRKPLFYTVNLVFPCAGISFCTVLVFYLPSDSGEKIGLSISILVSLTVFFLLLIEIVPATSIVLPLIGKYLLFTMIMVTLSVFITVVALNLHFRKPTTHRMPAWMKKLFLGKLPYYLLMRRPLDGDEDSFRRMSSRKKHEQAFMGKMTMNYHTNALAEGGERMQKGHEPVDKASGDLHAALRRERIASLYYSAPVLKAFRNVCFIAQLLKKKDRDEKIDEDWKYIAMVFDRLFLWIFSVVCTLGTAFILLRAPSITDTRMPVDQKHSPEVLAQTEMMAETVRRAVMQPFR